MKRLNETSRRLDFWGRVVSLACGFWILVCLDFRRRCGSRSIACANPNAAWSKPLLALLARSPSMIGSLGFACRIKSRKPLERLARW